MENPIDKYWQLRLADVKETLEANNFEVFLASNSEEASKMIIEQILPATGAKSVSWGGSATFVATGIYEKVKNLPGLQVLDTYEKGVPPEEIQERRRQGLLADLFITGTNAVTETGKLVNLDKMGNRVGAITFGPKNVILIVGRNKIVPDIEDAMLRIKNYTAPVNAMRLGAKTPCVQTSFCEECKGPARICNTWTITEKSFPKGRVKIVLVNEDLGI